MRIWIAVMLGLCVCTARGQDEQPTTNPATVVAEVRDLIRDRHSYAFLRIADEAELDTLADRAIERLGPTPTNRDLGDAITWLLARTGDAHASLRGWRSTLAGPFAPLLLAPMGNEPGSAVIAFDERRFPIDSKRLVVTSIDGVDIETWITAAGEYVADGSPQLKRSRAVQMLRYLGWLRTKLSLPPCDTAIYRLAPIDPASEVEPRDHEIELADHRAMYGEWPRARSSGFIEEGIGYLRFDRMHERPDGRDSERPAWRTILRHAQALVIDLRGNSGGSRDLVYEIVPRLIPEDHPPIVFTWARLRLQPGVRDDDEAAADRFMYPVSSRRWPPAHREAIRIHLREHGLADALQPTAQFGRPVFGVVASASGDRFSGPVVVLIDESCFSAADIMAAALAEVPGVELMGRPTGGGSAYIRRHELELAPLEVRLGQMDSRRIDGRTFDGNGVQPDIHVPATPADFLAGPDPLLDAALERLRKRMAESADS